MKFLVLLFAFCVPMFSLAQLSTVSKDAADADWFSGYDNLGAVCYVKNNVFFKKKDGRILQYQNISLGKIKRVDLCNPLNVLLFYEDFNTVVLLDNQLNETKRINFSDYPQPIVASAVGYASQNRIWVYNSLTQQLGLFDHLKNNYVVLTQQMRGNLRHYQTDFNTFQWVDETQMRFSCDVFGKISVLGKIPEFDSVQFASENVAIVLRNGKLYRFNASDQSEIPLEIPEKTPVSIWFARGILSIFTTEGISNYKITLP